MRRSRILVGALLLVLPFFPTTYASAAASTMTVSISGLDPNKTNFDPVVINHQRVFLPRSEWATCTVSPTQPGDSISYTWTVEHPGALDQPATVVSTDKRYYLAWYDANSALDSFLTCRAVVVRNGTTTQLANSVFVSHELPQVRLKISGVPIDANLQVGGTATCGYTANADNSVVSFAWSVSARLTGENDQFLNSGRYFTFTADNLALLKNKYLICRAHSGVDPYYLDTVAAALITDRIPFRAADPAKAVTTSTLPTFSMSPYLVDGNVTFGIDSAATNEWPSYLTTLTLKPGQVVKSNINTPVGAGIAWMEEKVYDANGRLATVAPMASKMNSEGSATWSTSWTIPKSTTIYADGYWTIKLVATRAADFQTAPAVTIAGFGVAGIVGTPVACTYSSGTISTQAINSTSYC